MMIMIVKYILGEASDRHFYIHPFIHPTNQHLRLIIHNQKKLKNNKNEKYSIVNINRQAVEPDHHHQLLKAAAVD